MADLLTSSLRMELERTNTAFQKWMESRTSWLHSSKLNYRHQEEEYYCTINALKENDKQLEQFKKVNDNIRQQQQSDIDRYVIQIDKLESQVLLLESQVKKFSDEEIHEQEKLRIIEKECNEMKIKSEKSINDLTRGVQLYLHLGLEFQKAPNDCMKFIFTQIDPKNPTRQFYFSIFVDELDKYQFVESYPSIEPITIKRLIDRLNQDSDISCFVYQMRKTFCKLLLR